VAALFHPIAWFREALRPWRISKRRAPANDPADDTKAPDLYHERNISLWCLLPPC
jgi:hypothetical protein